MFFLLCSFFFFLCSFFFFVLFFFVLFLSADDEILSILSETKDVTKVQPHLKKCFEGIVNVEFMDENRIGAMISREKEYIPLSQEVDPNGKAVEIWMTELQDQMKITIRDHVKDSIADYIVTPRGTWMQNWPGMCVINCSQFHWTREMELAINAKGTQGLVEELEKQKLQLAEMTILVRGKLSKNARTSIGALTVMDVHARDVGMKMISNGVDNVNDFDWLSQLRYYWREGEQTFWSNQGIAENMYCQMVASVREFGYEYLGNSFRLVITPLTDKCYLTLMGALQMVSCCCCCCDMNLRIFFLSRYYTESTNSCMYQFLPLYLFFSLSFLFSPLSLSSLTNLKHRYLVVRLLVQLVQVKQKQSKI